MLIAFLGIISGCSTARAPDVSPTAEGPPGEWSAAYSVNLPGTWRAGEEREYTVHVRNRGTAIWESGGANPTQLGAYFAQPGHEEVDKAVGEAHFALSTDVAPGATTDVIVRLVAPPGPGTLTLVHRMVRERIAWFDDSTRSDLRIDAPERATAYFLPVPGNDSSVVITLMNLGTMTWRRGGQTPVHLVVYAGLPPLMSDWARGARVDLPADVAPGESVTLRVVTPTGGSCGLYVRMVQEEVAWFEQQAVQWFGGDGCRASSPSEVARTAINNPGDRG